MANTKRNSIKLAFAFGAIAGMRTMAAPAILSHYLRRRAAGGLTNSNLEFLRTSIFDKAVKFLAAGEIFGDKLPQMPDRIAVTGLLGRAVSGAFVGGSIFKQQNEKAWKGALIGAVSSVASSFLFFYLRRQMKEKVHLRDELLGAAEDVLAIGGGVAAMELSDLHPN